MEKLGAHKVAGKLRGGKGSNFEAGTRVPFLVRWTGQIKPGVSNALVSQIDLLASFASFTGSKLADSDAPDSRCHRGAPRQGDNWATIARATVDRALARDRSWKYIEPSQGPAITANANIGTGNDPNGQLYDLGSDPGERQNLAAKYPERVREMAARLARSRARAGAGRKRCRGRNRSHSDVTSS